MVPHRRPSGRRILLPYELDLCESLGITPDEYWEFIFAAQETLKERGKEYDHIPDIRNAPVAPILINLVIGIALTAIGMLLAPKPKAQEQKQQRRLDIAGSRGRTRYSKSNNFDSVQQLASLGETIPLIFADHQKQPDGSEYGGIRVETDLLLSQMLSSGNNQILHALLTFGMGQLGAKPDINGFAIGDLLLRDFDYAKFKLYFRDSAKKGTGHRIGKNDDYDETKLIVRDTADAFSVYSGKSKTFEPFFSGTRTPSTKTQFGCHNPIANGHRFYLPFELVMVVDGTGSQAKEDSRAKREKLGRPYASYCGIISRRGSDYTYAIDNGPDFRPGGSAIDPDDLRPWGLSDVASIMNERRTAADERLQPNQDFMVGTHLGRVVWRSQSGVWAPESNEQFRYTLRLDNGGDVEFSNANNGTLGDTDGDKGGANPWERETIQQVSIASLSNNRPCNATEIGIKSEVWRQITGSINFNAFPTKDTIEEYEHDGGQISVGQITKYTKRYSFFTLYAREVGATSWIDITGSTPFAVRGTSPIAQYNTIYIDHPSVRPTAQEFKIVPVPGAKFYKALSSSAGSITVRLLTGTELYKASSETIARSDYRVRYTGVTKVITRDDASNPEWILNEAELKDYKRNGPITAINDYSNGKDPKTNEILDKESERYKVPGSHLVRVTKNNQGVRQYQYIWAHVQKGPITPEGERIRIVEDDNAIGIYERGRQEVEYSPEKWVFNPETSVYVVDIYQGEKSNNGMVTCVYKIPGTNTYRWMWNNSEIHRQNHLTKTWKERGKTVRYRVAQDENDNGNLIKRSSEGWKYTDDESYQNVYKPDGVNKRPQTGVRFKDGWYEFFKNNSLLGRSGSRYLYMKGVSTSGGIRGKDPRYKADTVRQEYRPETRESLGRSRDCDPDKDANVADCVTDGAVYQNTVQIRNPNNPNQTKDVPLLKLFVAGEKLYQGPAVEWNGNKMNIRGPGNIWYSATGTNESSPPMVGRIEGGKFPCYKVLTEKVTGMQYEEWDLTYQFIDIIPETYEIERQKLRAEVPGEYSIIRYNVITETEPKETYTTALVSQKEKGGGKDATVRVTEYKSGAATWKLRNPGKNYEVGEPVKINFEGKAGSKVTKVTGIDYGLDDEDWDAGYNNMVEKGRNHSPLNAICDYFINSTDNSSHAGGPEHNVVFCNEIIEQNASNPPKYNDLALCGIKITNSKEWTSFNNLSAWISKGIQVEHLLTGDGRGSKGPTNLFPEIAYALLTDERIGAGKLIGAASCDREAMARAAMFCGRNNFFWDGVIADNLNLREFIFANAGFILCDFTIKGGKFSLIPSVPYDSFWKINKKGKPNIRALFTDTNMRNMKVTFLSPEERQPFKAVMLYRQEKPNSFAETRTMTIRLPGGNHDSDPIEEFDMTQFCTSEEQARWFGRIALKLREKVDHGITFETTPQSAMNLEPGQYFKVASKVTHTDRFQSGSVTDGGDVISSENVNNSSFQVVYWKPGSTTTQTGNLTFAGKKTTQRYLFGTLWAKVQESESSRVYKVETLSYSDDGLVSVSGSHAPLTSAGTFAILDWSNNDFIEEVA